MNAIAKTALASPEVNDAKVAASLMQHCGLQLRERSVVIPGEPELEATAISSTANFEQSEALLLRALEPAPKAKLEGALATLWVKMAKRAGTNSDADLMLAAYTAELQRFPADIALQVLTEWPRGFDHKFWPAWAELEIELNRRTRWRRAALAAIKHAAAQGGEGRFEKSDDVAAGLRNLAASLRANAPVNAHHRRNREDRGGGGRPAVRSLDEQCAALRASMSDEAA